MLVTAAAALSALLGFGREIASAHFFGTSPEMDAFLNASTVPIVLFGVFSGALVSAFVPQFSEYFSTGRDEDAGKLGSTVINAMFLSMSALAGLGCFLAPFFVPIAAQGFSAKEQGLVVSMVRWLMPGIVASSVSSVCTALLNANHRFLSSALIWVVANIVTISSVLALHRQLGIFSLVLGSVLGLFAQLLVQFPALIRNGWYRLELDLHHPDLIKSWAALFPVALGSGASQINLASDRFFASRLEIGSTAAIAYTTKLAFLPILAAGAIATVSFPLIASQFAKSDQKGVKRSVMLALQMVGFFVIPAACALTALAYPLVEALFERGAFGPAATALCASLVPFACMPLIALSFTSLLARACYACREVPLAVAVSSGSVAINIALSAALSPILGPRGLLIANGVAGLFSVLGLASLIGRLVGGFEWKPLLLSLFRILLASLAMLVGLHLVHFLGFMPNALPILRLWRLASLIGFAVTVFLAAAHLLGVEELTIVVNALSQRIRRDVSKRARKPDDL